MFLWVWECFQQDLYLVKCQDRHGVGGDPSLSWTSALGNERLWRQRAEEEDERRGKTGEQVVIYVGVDCWLTLFSLSLLSLFAPHILPPVFQPSLFSRLSLSEALTLDFLALTHTQTRRWELSLSACTDELPISPRMEKGNGEKGCKTIYEDTNQISVRFSFNSFNLKSKVVTETLYFVHKTKKNLPSRSRSSQNELMLHNT